MEVQVKVEYGRRLFRIMNENLSYDTFRSELCHMYHFDGDYEFIKKVLKTNLVMYLWEKKEFAKSLYVLAVIDYISWKNDVPFFEEYEWMRKCKLKNELYPSAIVMLDKIEQSNKNRNRALEECKDDECGMFFFRHNIIERSIEDVI